jgi:hypothetical protein
VHEAKHTLPAGLPDLLDQLIDFAARAAARPRWPPRSGPLPVLQWRSSAG